MYESQSLGHTTCDANLYNLVCTNNSYIVTCPTQASDALNNLLDQAGQQVNNALDQLPGSDNSAPPARRMLREGAQQLVTQAAPQLLTYLLECDNSNLC